MVKTSWPVLAALMVLEVNAHYHNINEAQVSCPASFPFHTGHVDYYLSAIYIKGRNNDIRGPGSGTSRVHVANVFKVFGIVCSAWFADDGNADGEKEGHVTITDLKQPTTREKILYLDRDLTKMSAYKSNVSCVTQKNMICLSLSGFKSCFKENVTVDDVANGEVFRAHNVINGACPNRIKFVGNVTAKPHSHGGHGDRNGGGPRRRGFHKLEHKVLVAIMFMIIVLLLCVIGFMLWHRIQNIKRARNQANSSRDTKVSFSSAVAQISIVRNEDSRSDAGSEGIEMKEEEEEERPQIVYQQLNDNENYDSSKISRNQCI